jgi:hypothetical protein
VGASGAGPVVRLARAAVAAADDLEVIGWLAPSIDVALGQTSARKSERSAADVLAGDPDIKERP